LQAPLTDWGFQLPVEIRDQMHTVESRSYYVASIFAARVTVPQDSGLIVNISSRGAIKCTGNVSYNVVMAGVDMLTLASAEALRRQALCFEVTVWGTSVQEA